MAMEWLELKANTKAKLAGGDAYPKGRTIIYKVMAPAGHNGVGHGGKQKLVNPEVFLDNAIEEYGKKLVSEVFFKQYVVQAQANPRRLMEQGAMDTTIKTEMENWKLNEKARQDPKTTEKIIMDRWMSEFRAASTLEEKLAVFERMQARQAEMATEDGEESDPEPENGVEDVDEEDEETPDITSEGPIVATTEPPALESIDPRFVPRQPR